MSNDDLRNVDLVRTICPSGTTIAIEGMGSYGAENMSLYDAILAVYVVLSNGQTLLNARVDMITLLELDEDNRFIRVRLTL